MYQQLLIVGRVGKDAEMRYTPGGQAVTSFSVAVDDGYGDKKITLWYRVSCFGKTAEACNTYVKKGSVVLCEGRLSADPATGGPKTFAKKDGTTGASFEMVANTVKFLPGGTRTEQAAPDVGDGDF